MSIFHTIYDRRHYNSTFWYNVKNYVQYFIPDCLYARSLQKVLLGIKDYDEGLVMERVNYYNKLTEARTPDQRYITLKDFRLSELKRFKPTTHFFDTYRYTRYFDKNLPIALTFGDNKINPPVPSIVKSRPLFTDNSNAVLLKLNALRHFMFVKDGREFAHKRDMLIGRSTLYFANRKRFFEQYYGHPLCDLGQVQRKNANPQWARPHMTIDEQLQYKFILALEGNDVATNLKWIMSSNSLAVMPKPKYETWFMEGRLVPDFHYVAINDDFSDLEEKLRFYIDNAGAARCIINNAHEWVGQFGDARLERLIGLLVLRKYFL